MPELPEVETIRLYLHRYIVDKTIGFVDIREPKMFHGNPSHIIGSQITDTSRKGKVLVLHLSTKKEKNFLSFHLKLSGQILFAPDKDNYFFPNSIPLAKSKKMPAKTTRIIIYFTDNSALYFNDLRKFGWAKLSSKPEYPTGIDILSDKFTEKYLLHLGNTRKPIKTVLLDQNILAGIGNIYANDALWEACIHPARATNTLTPIERKRLYHAIKKTITEGLAHKGSSAKDELYVLPDSTPGNYQKYFKTYHKQATACKRCGKQIVSMKISGRGTFYCPSCQK